ncbi:hypothetical protein Leryth_023149 [Lithospermum erythrorhizon]|nr:hypothetical protein Leryth_023149 [Lithospermum erythrorhizon]
MATSSEYAKPNINMLFEQEKRYNKATVSALYKALANNGHKMEEEVMIASDLEWWFHGPQDCHYMMKMLTGEKSCNGKQFKFEPRIIDVVGAECVIVEGWEGVEAYWVHVWIVKEGVITQFREYFNTWLIVKDVKPQIQGGLIKATKSPILWQSNPRDLAKRSLPGIMLAI